MYETSRRGRRGQSGRRRQVDDTQSQGIRWIPASRAPRVTYSSTRQPRRPRTRRKHPSLRPRRAFPGRPAAPPPWTNRRNRFAGRCPPPRRARRCRPGLVARARRHPRYPRTPRRRPPRGHRPRYRRMVVSPHGLPERSRRRRRRTAPHRGASWMRRHDLSERSRRRRRRTARHRGASWARRRRRAIHRRGSQYPVSTSPRARCESRRRSRRGRARRHERRWRRPERPLSRRTTR
mmetsp:Transcript_33927/g.95445  ORF Transcript_33927/g.95445 Transcript_33927/m.95445 type:complete len:235 (+) Transcript_33927:1339-2043(+)